MKLIGDPHLGKEFKANVPLDRRGEREQMMLDEFQDQLEKANDDLIVIVGDLFEHWFITYEALYRTLKIILRWQLFNPHKNLVILRGNHDYSPTGAVVGAFHILELCLYPYDNIDVLRAPKTLHGVVFFPWEWDRTALEQLDVISEWTDTAVGHWDLGDYGGSTDHLCPARELKTMGVENIFSGHWHIAGDYSIDGVEVKCTGSMQPMTHAEDPEGKLYITLTVQEYGRTDPETLRNRYVRVVGESLDGVLPPPTCLGFKTQKRSTQEAEAQERVTLEGFDMKKILDESLVRHSVPEEIQARIKGRLNDIA